MRLKWTKRWTNTRRSLAGLVSETATAEITSALGPLSAQREPGAFGSVGRGGVTLEDIVREEIRRC